MPKNNIKLVRPALEGTALLSFGLTNAKLPKNTATFTIPAGHTCPGACDCLSKFDRKKRKIIDGPKTEFRCFAASMEAARVTLRKSTDRNLAVLREAKTASRMAEVIDLSMPARRYDVIRVHVGGDFFNESYFKAWMQVARDNPNRLFYGYTKSLPIWIKHRDLVPENYVLTASRGGKWDSLIEPNGLRSSVVVYHPDEAKALGLEIDHDDSHARRQDGKDFALLIHGTQPAGSRAAEAKKRLDAEGIQYAYTKKKTKTNNRTKA